VTEDRPELMEEFWGQVRVNVASWLAVAGLLGVGYIAWTVPRSLDLIQRNQEDQRQDMIQLKTDLRSLEVRTTKLEARP